ncbi:MAG: hypothetical protein QXQ24_08285 [Nitrososphaeria archaeon]
MLFKGVVKMCLFPRLIHNKKYTITKKNKGIVPEIKDERVKFVPVGCGKCIECLKKKAREWKVRLHEELLHDDSGKFITLTFSDDSLIKLEKELTEKAKQIQDKRYNYKSAIHPNLVATRAVRLFLERWRKKYKKSVKHWFITELGSYSTERIHLHGIIFTNQPTNVIQEIWKYGNIWIGNYVNNKTINYIIKYCTKIDPTHKNYVPQILCSKGIGKGYLNRLDSQINKFKGTETKEYYRTKEGFKLSLPVYYRNKLYTEEEREQLWLNMLDKQERYILGNRIDISNGEDEYYLKLKWAQSFNKNIGYGDDSKDWQEKDYRNIRKMLKKYKSI